MKAIIRTAAAAALILFTSICAMAQPEIYRKYSSTPGITKVYISPAMMKLVGLASVSDVVNDDDINIGALAGKMNSLYLLMTENKELGKKMMADFDKLVTTKKVELLMEAGDGEDNILIYSEMGGELIKSLYLSINGEEDNGFIILTGNFTLDDVGSIINSK